MGSDDGSAPRASSTAKRIWTTFTAISLFAIFIVAAQLFWPTRRKSITPLETAFVLRNHEGVEIHILPTGASIHRLLLPDRKGRISDVALGMDSEAGYSDGTSPYFGAIAGRFANRIANASFTLDGKTHHLRVNEKGFPGSLHGGVVGFDKVRWQATRLLASEVQLQHGIDGEAIHLVYRSADGEQGYPGNLEAEITYLLTSRGNGDGESVGELIQSITATTDAPTVINLAQHSYFNLAGHDSGRSILSHELTLHDATHVLPVDSHRIPTGEFRAVANTPFDFTARRLIGEGIETVDGPGWHAGYDHCFVLHGAGHGEPGGRAHKNRRSGGMPVADDHWWLAHPKRAATLRDPTSGRTMEIRTTAPGLQLYTSNFLDGTLANTKDGATYEKYAGVCLETQSFPDGPNREVPLAEQPMGKKGPYQPYPTGVLRPGEVYRHKTVYRFSVR